MVKRENIEFLKDILESIERIDSYVGNLRYEKFLKDLKTRDAVVRNLEIIGEAAKHIPANIRLRYKEIEWKKISGLRDKIIHYYFGVNWEIVWDVIEDKLPKLKIQIEKIK
ncbi:MAG: DUF86 domain-containing protein [Candidatus Omnitrophota bacterium]